MMASQARLGQAQCGSVADGVREILDSLRRLRRVGPAMAVSPLSRLSTMLPLLSDEVPSPPDPIPYAEAVAA